MGKIEKKILNLLITKYEESKTFTGDSKVNQRFKVRISKMFPRYEDADNYDGAMKINDAIDYLCRLGYISKVDKNKYEVDLVYLNLEKLEEVYQYLNREKKGDRNVKLLTLFDKYHGRNDLLDLYIKDQLQRIKENKKVKHFSGDINKLEELFTCIVEMAKLEDEVFEREFSISVFKDSKRLNAIKQSVETLLYEYGEFTSRDVILPSFNLVKTPSYVNLKGDGIVTVAGQEIDLSVLDGDIALSSALLDDIDSIQVMGSTVITVENLTSFHTFNQQGFFVIYLGGFHNSARGNMIKKIYEENKSVSYYHFGDIDVGGYRILKHLREHTGVPFLPFKMGVDILKEYREYGKPLTENDKKSLKAMLGSEFEDVFQYMLNNNIKLEQECVKV